MRKFYLSSMMVLVGMGAFAQYPSVCGTISARNNSNGQANSCAGVNGTPMASNFTGTAYAAVPVGAKTADITFKYLNVNYATLTPYAITEIANVVNGVTTVINAPVGPASVPALTGSTDAQVQYCVYITNIPTSGTLKFRLTDPQTGSNFSVCFYDASCNANCIVTGSVLPVEEVVLKAVRAGNTVILDWPSSQVSTITAFEIEKSTDGQQFSTIDVRTVSNSSASYRYTDMTAASAPVSYYRLKQLSTDGSFSYSNIAAVSMKSGFSVSKFAPNPFINEVSLDVVLEAAAPVRVRIMDVKGVEMVKKTQNGTVGLNRVSIDGLAQLPKGIYVLSVSSGKAAWQQKLVK